MELERQQKVVPISTNQLRLAGVGGILFVFFSLSCWWFNMYAYSIELGELDTERELLDFYDKYESMASQCLFLCALQWLCVPLIMYFKICLNLCHSKLRISYVLNEMNNLLFTVLIVISTTMPVPLVMCQAFTWDFKQNDGKTMVPVIAIMLAFVRFAIILVDSTMIAMIGINLIHWYLVITIKKGLYYILSALIIFGGLVQNFGWGDGFWSVHGGSQYFSFITIISFTCIPLWMVLNAKTLSNKGDMNYSPVDQDGITNEDTEAN